MATKTRVSMRLEVGDRLAEPKGGYRIRMARGESESVEVSAELLDGGRPFDASGLSARFMAVLAGGRHVAMPVPPEGVSGGTLTYTLPSGLGATPGDTRLAVFELSDGEGYRIYTEPFTVSVADGPSPTSAEIGPYVPELDALLAQLKTAIRSAGEATGAADDAAAKAEAAAAEADDAAAKAEAAIAEVKATEAKLYPAAENLLVGSDSGAVAHVEDAFAGASLRKIVVEGAAKQDGIPSPDAPKPISVIENPTVKVVGRNLWPFASSYTSIDGHQNEFVNDKTSFTILPGAYTFSAAGSLCNTDAPLFGYTATGKRIQLFQIMRNVTNPKYSFIVTEPIASIYFVSNAADSNTGTISSIQLERNSTATEYTPYVSQSLDFTLPTEHPYLAKLPDGTADTIEVDEAGNVELVARVLQIKVPEGITWSIQEQQGGFSLGYTGQILALDDIKKNLNASALMCDRFRGKKSWENNPCFGVSGVLWVVPRTNQSDITSEDVAAVANGMVFYAPLATSVTYPIGKIEMPKAQDSIVNAWTDAEVTPNTGIRYVRDVNIVVANLEAAIASITEG